MVKKLFSMFKRPYITLKELPEEIQGKFYTDVMVGILLLILCFSINILIRDFYIFILSLFCILVSYAVGVSFYFLFLYDKVMVIEGKIIERQLLKVSPFNTGSFLFIQCDNLYFRVKVPISKMPFTYQKETPIRIYTIPSAIYQKEDDLFVINNALFVYRIKKRNNVDIS